MGRTVEAIFENGVLRPLTPLTGIAECSKVRIRVEFETPSPHPVVECAGTLPDEDAQEMLAIIEEEFEQVNLSEWN